MRYCVNPHCQKGQNPDTVNVCQNCGLELLLQERYAVVKPIGKGGFGKTFLAIDTTTENHDPYVIKQFYFTQPDPESLRTALRLFRQEAERLEQLGKHPQIPKFYGFFQQSEQIYLVQEYISGQNLQEELVTQGSFPESKIWQVLTDLLPVLKFIHNQQIIHRDIKPANLMRQVYRLPDDETIITSPKPKKVGQIMLIDFGVAKLLTGSALMQTGTIVGSAEYMSPEQTRGKVLPASDLYSLGVTCLYLLTGVSPWDMYDHVNEKWSWRDFLPSGGSVSDRLGKVLDKLIDNSLNRRYESAEQVLELIDSYSAKAQATTKVIDAHQVSKQKIKKIAPIQPLQLSWRQIVGQYLPDLAPIDSQEKLLSDAGVDYRQLQYLLSVRQWREADIETWRVLSFALGKRRKSYLFANELDNLPCQDLATIDQLWSKYSGGKFGFRIQKQIFESVQRDYGEFCDQVGWLTHNTHNPSHGFTYKLSSPVGHLPSRIFLGGSKWWNHAEIMANKLAKCGID